MELFNHLMNWLNAEDSETILQRDGVYALLSWRDFNQPAQPLLTFRAAALLFIFAVALPVLVMVQ